MSEYTLSNTAGQIDSAITRVHNADPEPRPGSANMVTSGGVKAAIDSLSQGGVTAASLGDSLDTVITSDATDSLIPTSKAVADYITAVNVPPSALYIDSIVQNSSTVDLTQRNFDSITTSFSSIFSLTNGYIQVSQTGLYSIAFQITVDVYGYPAQIKLRNINHHNTLDTSISANRYLQQVNEDFYAAPSMGRDGTHRFVVPQLIYIPAGGSITFYSQAFSTNTMTNMRLSISQVSKVNF